MISFMKIKRRDECYPEYSYLSPKLNHYHVHLVSSQVGYHVEQRMCSCSFHEQLKLIKQETWNKRESVLFSCVEFIFKNDSLPSLFSLLFSVFFILMCYYTVRFHVGRATITLGPSSEIINIILPSPGPIFSKSFGLGSQPPACPPHMASTT